MIKKISLKNFKSHEDTSLDFKNLTVLCGANSMGKSSVLQAILLLREAFLNKSEFRYLDLKSNSANLGEVVDILYQYSSTNTIEFEIETQNNSFHFAFEAKDSELSKTLIYKSSNVKDEIDLKTIASENIFRKDFQFISAARLGPQASYKKNDVVVDEFNQISVINGQAEYCVHFLERNKDKPVLKELRNSSIQSDGLFDQTIAWESAINEGVNMIVEDRGSLGYELSYQYETGNNTKKTNKFKASNVGFGLTYAMPVIASILSAQADTLLFIENPEAHLHPHGQAKLAELICLAAQAGVQIVIETHSDHIINGILVHCKKFEESGYGIDRRNVGIFNFSRNQERHCSIVENIDIQPEGRLLYTPTAFFDQFTIDRKYLMGF